jgi:nicotinamide-nucleotide amidase
MGGIRSAGILAVGSELLTPFRTDTNSAWLTARLNDLGIDVRLSAVVGDDAADLAGALRLALARADLVVATGGLGPTSDDLTRDVAAAVAGLGMELDDAVLAKIRARFERRGRPMPPSNARQAQVPAGADVLENDVGTAPGLWIPAGERIVVLLPGPPAELQPMFDRLVAPRLQALGVGRKIRRRVIAATGQPESAIDEAASPVYRALEAGAVPISTSILASAGQIELHLSAAGADVAAVDRALDAAVERLAAVLGPVVFSVDGRSLEQVVGEALAARRLRIAAAESCTAGLALARLTDVPGSSAWVVGGVVAYDNAVKIGALGVPAALIESHGAVSEPVADAMAEGVRRRLGADVGLAITGIAGPSGGTPGKPVGTVVVAMAGPGSSAIVRTLAFAGDRAMIRRFSVAAALDLVRRTLA